MGKLARVIQRVFGEDGGAGEFGEFGSNAASPPGTTTKDLTDIQSLSQYLDGWYAATANAGEPPRIQDRNALDLLFSSQLKYLFQNGIPEWLDDSDQLYYADVSFVTRSGSIYQAIKGDDGANTNAEKDPLTEPLWWKLVSQNEGVPAWDTAESTDYEDAGFIVERFGTHYAASGKSGNSGKDPADPQSDTWWIPSKGWDRFKDMASEGACIPGGMHPWTDFSSGDYQQSIKLDEIIRGGVTYDIFGVILDGTQLTGDATLEAIFDPGGGDEYPWIDEFAPDDGGTRTLIDMRGRSTRAMTDAGGVADTLAEVQEDRFQGHRMSVLNANELVGSGGGDNNQSAATGGATWSQEPTTGDPVTDGTNGTPRTGLETRIKALVRGVDYIIVMKAS